MPQSPSYTVTLVVRTAGDPESLGPALKSALHVVNPDQPDTRTISLEHSLRDRTAGLRAIGAIMMALGAVALALSAIGIYCLMAYYVSQRKHEIGVRMALGATRGDVLRLTMGQTAKLSPIGLGIGLVLAIAAGAAVKNVLFGIVSLQPPLLIGLAAALSAVALIASVVPAREATRIEPISALRGD